MPRSFELVVDSSALPFGRAASLGGAELVERTAHAGDFPGDAHAARAPDRAIVPVALGPLEPSASRLDYVRGSVSSPVCVAAAVFVGFIGLGYAGMLGAALAVAAVVAGGIHAAGYRCVRAHVDGQERVKRRLAREAARLRGLRPSGGARMHHYTELRQLVEEVERLDPREAVRFELQDLLDHFVDVAVDHQRCVEALRLAGASALPLSSSMTDAHRSSVRRDILRRRIEQRDACLRTMEQLADELEGTDELIRLIAQRAATAPVRVEVGRELERRLWEMDEVDAAMRQLSAHAQA